MSTKPKLTTGTEANHFIEKVREKYLSKGDVFPLQDKTVTENGEVKADSEYYGLNKVTVNVLPVMEPTTVISTGTEQIINPPSGVTGFSKITVNPIDLEDKIITENGVYTSETKSGFGEVTVDVESENKLNQLLKVSNGGSGTIQVSESDFDGVTYLGNTFYANNGLKSVEIPSSVTTIWNNAFNSCSELTTVVIDNPSILKLGGYVFQRAGSNSADGLSITFKNMNNKIYDNWGYDSNTFAGANIKQISIPNGTLYLPSHCFSGCTNLETVNLPTELQALKDSEFYRCSKLASVTIPAKCSTIQTMVFAQCPLLRTVNIEDRINSSDTINIQNNAWESTVTTINIYCRKSQVVTASSAPWGASSSCQVNWLHPDDQV